MTLASANKQGLTTSNFQCETGSTISTMFLFCVAYVTGASDTLIGYSTSSIYLNFQSSTPYMSRASNNAIWGSTETSTAKNFSGYFSSTSNLVGVSVDNGTYVTASATNGTANNNLTLGLGIRGDASTQPMSGKIACGIVVNVVPTSTQLSNLQSWANNLFGT